MAKPTMDDLIKMLMTGQTLAQLSEQGAADKKNNPIKVMDFVEAGQTVTSDIPLHIKGPVGADAAIHVKGGGVLIDGEVGDHASITVEDSVTSETISVGGGTIRVSGSSNVNVIINGKKYEIPANNKPQGIHIKGQIGKDVGLNSDADITIEGDTGTHLKLTAGRDTVAASVGASSNLKIGRDAKLQTIFDDVSVNVGRDLDIKNTKSGGVLAVGRDMALGDAQSITFDVGRDATIASLGAQSRGSARDITVAEVGDTTDLTASRDFTAAAVGAHSSVSAGRDATVAKLGEKASLRATRDATVKSAHRLANVRAKRNVNVTKHYS